MEWQNVFHGIHILTNNQASSTADLLTEECKNKSKLKVYRIVWGHLAVLLPAHLSCLTGEFNVPDAHMESFYTSNSFSL